MKFWNGEAFEGLYDENGQQSKGEYTYLSGNCYDGSFKHKERYNVDTSLLYSTYVLVCRINRDFIRD